MASETDLEWRFQGLGYKIVSARYIANEFHLYHKRKDSEYDRGLVEQMQKNKNNNVFRCIDGLN
jgi:hypothetical protein